MITRKETIAIRKTTSPITHGGADLIAIEHSFSCNARWLERKAADTMRCLQQVRNDAIVYL
jgi:hypothetical protein